MQQGLISLNLIECIKVTVERAKVNKKLMQAHLSGKELC